MQQCSSTLKKLTLELGGNGAFIVFEDANLEKAASGKALWTRRPNRVFVHKSVVNKFVRMMKEKISELKFGHGLEPGT
jgi:succinate-semialdehyde dehydrogenase/glutarate-semialdehyde dehydrogenase